MKIIMKRDIINPEKGIKGLFGIFAAALIIALPLRAYQLIFLIDPETGFYAKTNFTVPLLYVLLILAGIAFITLSFFPKNMPFGGTVKGGKVFAVLSFLIAVSFIIDAGIQTSEIFAALTFTDVTGYAVPQTVTTSSVFSSDTLLIFARIIFAVISCIYFAILGFNYCGIIYDVSQFKLLALGPLAWVIVRLVSDFMWKINYRNISDLLFEMFMLAAFMFFFMSFARINSNIGRETAYRKLYGFGFIGSLISLMLSVPRLVLIIIGQSERVVNDFTFSLADFLIGIFIISYLFVNIKSPSSSNPSQVEEIE